MGGGEDSCGVGGVGVLASARVFGIWEDGGGVIEEVVGGAGEVNLTRSGETTLTMPDDGGGEPEGETEESILGVAGREYSVDGMRENCESWDRGAWESILPSAAEWPKPPKTRQKHSRVAGVECKAGFALAFAQWRNDRNARYSGF